MEDLFDQAETARRIRPGPHTLRMLAAMVRRPELAVPSDETADLLDLAADAWERDQRVTVVSEPEAPDGIDLARDVTLNLEAGEADVVGRVPPEADAVLSDLDAFLQQWEAHITEGHDRTIRRSWWIGVGGMQRLVTQAMEHLGGHPYPKGGEEK